MAKIYCPENRAPEEFTPEGRPVYTHILLKYEYFWNICQMSMLSYKIYVIWAHAYVSWQAIELVEKPSWMDGSRLKIYIIYINIESLKIAINSLN